jgi:hypothetical protein
LLRWEDSLVEQFRETTTRDEPLLHGASLDHDMNNCQKTLV